jgi:hypothetical protein
MSGPDEFSPAFDGAFDAPGGAAASSGGMCFPPGADWGCSYTLDQLEDMRAKPEVSAAMDRADALAWMQLAALTADQVGTCPIAVRPCAARCHGGGTYVSAPVGLAGHTGALGNTAFTPHINVRGDWVNGCGHHHADCSCTTLCEVLLPGPVGDVVEVWLEGAALPWSAYRVDNGNRLVRTDGECWPACQDMSQPEHGADAFTVTYYRGAAPDGLSLYVAGLLAVEYYKACISDKSCRLPARLQSVARQGVTYQVAFGDDESTGIREVDDYVRRLNPYRLKMAPVIVSPQSRRARSTTWSR